MTIASTPSSAVATPLMARLDGRLPDSMRPLTIERGVIRNVPGSVMVSFGHTKVLVTASVEERVPKHIFTSPNAEEGWITAEYSLLPASTGTRNQRERNKLSGRTAEIQRLIGRSLRAAVDRKQLGQRTITIDADVLQADGGTRVASITGGFVALMDALLWLKAYGGLKTLPPITPIAAVSVGVLNNTVLLDLNYEEDLAAHVDANVVMTAEGNLIEFQATAEEGSFTPHQLTDMHQMAWQGIQHIVQAQYAALAVPLLSDDRLMWVPDAPLGA
ncbi:MAG: ribonuclease PH [Vampirovibrionales bacterium]